MTNEPKHPCPERAAPLVPSMPECDVLRYGQTVVIEGLRDYARQCAEIAQAQAQRADGAERRAEYWKAEHNAANAEIDKLHATLAQRDREVLALREAAKESAIAWEVCRSIHETWAKGKDPLYKTRHLDFVRAADKAREALASTAQAGAEAERKIKEWCVESAWKWWNDRSPERPCGRDTLEAAILGTGGEAVDLSRCPKCGGPADNGHDRCLPPNPYFCTKCESGEER